MAESVDALVSNTNAFGRAGSTPALGTKAPLKKGAFFMSKNNSFLNLRDQSENLGDLSESIFFV